MKRIILLILSVCFINCTVSEAQMTKGKISVGISSGINAYGEIGTGSDFVGFKFGSMKVKSNATGFEEPKADKLTSINLLPSVGYFLIDNLALGLDMTLSTVSVKDGESDSKDKLNMFLGGPFVKYYFQANNIYPFVTGSVLFGSAKYKEEWDGGSDETKTGLTSFGGGAGMAVPLGEKVTFDIMASYSSLTAKQKEDNPDDERNVIGTFGIKFGFVIYLGAN